jgi:hypothetical protein
MGGCDTFVKYVEVWLDNGVSTCTEKLGMFAGALPPCIYSNVPATNSPIPPGCDLINNGDCTGWQTVATFLPGFQGNIKANVEAVLATSLSSRHGGFVFDFDILCAATFADPTCTTPTTPSPIATVSPGQTLVVTIAFTVS